MRGACGAAIVSVAIWWGLGCSGGGGAGPGAGGGGGSGRGGTGGNGTPTGVPLASFGQAYEEAFCAPLVTCGVYPDLATCEAATPFAETSFVLTEVAAAQRGTVRYDPVAAASCIAGLPRDCPVLFDYGSAGVRARAALDLTFIVPACANIFTGQLAQGEGCQISPECGPGTYCYVLGQPYCTLNQCCPGTCHDDTVVPIPPHALGEDCTDNLLCQLPAVCDGTCIIPPAEGASCDPSASYPCGQLDEHCLTVGMYATTGICTKRTPVGASCVPTLDGDGCLLDETCQGNPTTTVFTCAARRALGDPCDSADACLAQLTCTSAGVCGPVTPGMDCGPSP